MVDLIIVCEDSFGMDVRMIAEAINDHLAAIGQEKAFRITGYLCPKGVALKQNSDRLPILGTIEEWTPKPNERFAMGIVSPGSKELAAVSLKNRGAQFVALWAPWVLAPPTVQFGEGSIIAAYSIGADAQIGKFVTLYNSMVANSVIGEYSSVMAYSNTTSAEIGKKTYVGDNAAIMIGVTVGEGAHICQNSVVVKNVKAGTKVSGIPAKKVRE